MGTSKGPLYRLPTTGVNRDFQKQTTKPKPQTNTQLPLSNYITEESSPHAMLGLESFPFYRCIYGDSGRQDQMPGLLISRLYHIISLKYNKSANTINGSS